MEFYLSHQHVPSNRMKFKEISITSLDGRWRDSMQQRSSALPIDPPSSFNPHILLQRGERDPSPKNIRYVQLARERERFFENLREKDSKGEGRRIGESALLSANGCRQDDITIPWWWRREEKTKKGNKRGPFSPVASLRFIQAASLPFVSDLRARIMRGNGRRARAVGTLGRKRLGRTKARDAGERKNSEC